MSEVIAGIDYGKIREIVRKELDDLYLGEVEYPSELKLPLIGSIVEHPDGQIYCLVMDRGSGKTYVCEMEDPFKVSRVVKEVWPNVNSNHKLFYDDVNDGWLLLAYSTKGSGAAIRRLDRNFNEVATQDPMIVDGAEVNWNAELGPFIYCHDFGDQYGLLALMDTSSALGVAYTPDYSKLPLPEWTWKPYRLLAEANTYTKYNDEYGRGIAIDGAYEGIQFGSVYAFLLHTHSLLGQVLPAWLIVDREAGRCVAGYSLDAIVSHSRLFNMRGVVGSGCTVTNVFGKELLLYQALFLYKNGALHKVKTLVQRLPLKVFDYTKHRVIWHVWIDEDIEAGATSPAIPGFGRKTIFFTSDTPGDLTAYLDAIGRNDWKELFTLTGITSALEQTTFSGLRMRFKFSASAKVSLYVVTEP